MTSVQHAWTDSWLLARGCSATNRLQVEEAEQCVADGIDEGVWSNVDPPTPAGIRSRCGMLEVSVPEAAAVPPVAETSASVMVDGIGDDSQTAPAAPADPFQRRMQESQRIVQNAAASPEPASAERSTEPGDIGAFFANVKNQLLRVAPFSREPVAFSEASAQPMAFFETQKKAAPS